MGSLLPFLLPALLSAPDTLVLKTGSATGSYQAVGEAIAQAVQAHVPDIVIRLEHSSGSVENVRAVASGEADLAIVQNDIAYFADRGQGPFQGAPLQGLRAMVGLHYEDIILIVRRASGIESASQLRPHHRVVVGERDSGTLENAAAVLGGLGLTLSSLDTIMRVPRQSLHLLKTDSADAIFLTAGVGAAFLEEVEANDGRVVPLPDPLIHILRERHPYFDATELQVGGRSIPTLRIRSLLVSREDLPPPMVREVTGAIVSELAAIRASHPRAAEILPGTLTQAVSLAPHRGAISALCDARVASCSQGFPYLMALSVVLTAAFLSLRYSRGARGLLQRLLPRLARHVVGPLGVTERYRYFLIPVVVAALLVGGAFTVQRAEERYARKYNVNSDFDDLGLNQNLVWMVVFTASGFEDGRFPKSTVGKLTSALMGVAGVGGVLLFFGLLTSDHVVRRIRMGKRVDPGALAHHVIIAGWSTRAPGIVRSLTDPQLGPRRQFVVVLADLPEDPMDENHLEDDFAVFIRGIPSDIENLKKAGLDRADSLIVLADESIPRADRDARGLLTLILAEKHTKTLLDAGKRRSKLHTVVEIMDPANRTAMELAYADQIICRREFDERVLVQSVLNPGVAALLQEILTVDDTNEVIEVPVTLREGAGFVGLNFREALERGLEFGALLVAIHRNGAPGATREAGAPRHQHNLMVNPVADEANYRIQAGDSLLFIADSEQTLKPEFGDPNKWRGAFHGAG